MTDMLNLVWSQLQADIQRVKAQAETALARSERAETAGGVASCAYADLPYAATGAGKGNLRFVTNVRKVGEGPGAGTGTLCYYNVGDDTWRRVGDDTVAAI